MISLVSLIRQTFKGNNPVQKPEWARQYDEYRGQPAGKSFCQAPFKSMYFGHGGKVVTCCINREYTLGQYPENGIREIWFGAKADALREYLKNYNLDHGCEGCKSMILAGNYEAVKVAQYDPLRANRNRYPSVMEFELSNECNLGCIMCTGEFSSFIRKHVEKLPPIPSVYDSEFIRQLEEFIPYLEETKFYGGEPFLVPIYQEIWDLIIKLNPKTRISVQTNATILTERIKNLLEGGMFHINVSIDSLQKERYESIRRNAVFEKVMENIRHLRAYTLRKNTFFGLSFCLMRNNWDEAPDFIRFCNALGCKAYFHTVHTPRPLALMTWDAPSLRHILGTFARTTFEADTEVSRENVRHFEHWIRQVQQWMQEKETRRMDGSRYMEIIRNRMEDLDDKATEALVLEKLEWMEGIGFGTRQFDVSPAEMNDTAWVDGMIRLLVSNSNEELLEMIEHG